MSTVFNPTLRLLEEIKSGKKERGIVDGYITTVGVSEDNVHRLQAGLTPRPSDVFVVSFPKSGTTWMQQIVKLIWNGGKEDGRDANEALPWLELMTPEEAEVMTSPRGFKSHLPYSMLPGGEPAKSLAKYIYVYRNPKDVAVSDYHQIKAFFSNECSWKMYLRQFCSGQVGYGFVLDHILGWWKHKDVPNILVISYESMKRDLESAVSKVAMFLGYELAPSILSDIVHQTMFGTMKNNPKANFTFGDHLNYRSNGSPPFMRKGVIGDWKSMFSDEESKQMDVLVAEKMAGTDIKFDYGDE